VHALGQVMEAHRTTDSAARCLLSAAIQRRAVYAATQRRVVLCRCSRTMRHGWTFDVDLRLLELAVLGRPGPFGAHAFVE